MPEQKIEFETERQLHQLYGESPANLNEVERMLSIRLVARGNCLTIEGEQENVDRCGELFSLLLKGREQGFVSGKSDFGRFLAKVSSGKTKELQDLLQNPLVLKIRKKSVVPRNLGQRRFLDLILKNDLVFGIGPAGTGKTFLAMIAALHALLEGEIQRIVLARPAVEAGEALGFLPGDLEEKLLPYLRPLYDAMDEVLGPIEARKLVETGVVEIAPLAYMRGRTLSKCFALLDEAQNATRSQMMMFLTRLGEGSKMVVTGDVTQVDLPTRQESGLVHASKTLSSVKGLHFHEFDHDDVVRHPLVSSIISAYGKPPSDS
jgi:phosphate starvation-inducible protein PhoH and related proteins